MPEITTRNKPSVRDAQNASQLDKNWQAVIEKLFAALERLLMGSRISQRSNATTATTQQPQRRPVPGRQTPATQYKHTVDLMKAWAVSRREANPADKAAQKMEKTLMRFEKAGYSQKNFESLRRYAKDSLTQSEKLTERTPEQEQAEKLKATLEGKTSVNSLAENIVKKQAEVAEKTGLSTSQQPTQSPKITLSPK